MCKGLQLVGLMILGVGFIVSFPDLMHYEVLGFGLVFFFMGWLVQKFGLNNS
mgnify:CR=1 FL=1